MSAATFGTYLKKHRKKKGLTQDELSAITGIEKRTISRIERGITYPYREQIFILAKALDMSIDGFIWGEEKYNIPISDSEVQDIIMSVPEKYRPFMIETLQTMADGFNKIDNK